MSDLLDLLFAEPDDELGRLLSRLQWLVLEYPIAAREIVSALAAEGRVFATTEEGQRWHERLADSELVRRGQLIWDLGTWNVADRGDQILPTQLIEAFSRACARDGLERALAARLEPQPENEPP